MISAANSLLLSSLWSGSVSAGYRTNDLCSGFWRCHVGQCCAASGSEEPTFLLVPAVSLCLWLLFRSGPSLQLFVLGSQTASGRGLYSQESPERTCEVKLQQQGQAFAACWELLP